MKLILSLLLVLGLCGCNMDRTRALYDELKDAKIGKEKISIVYEEKAKEPTFYLMKVVDPKELESKEWIHVICPRCGESILTIVIAAMKLQKKR